MGDVRAVEGVDASWGAADVVPDFETEGCSDPGEEAALAAVAGWRLGDVLDLGVGAGRTTGLLLEEARSYVGVDIAAEMVEVAQRRFPRADLRVGDAADLSAYAEDSVDLLVFSYNGLDSLDHEHRGQALREMARVTRPGGRVLFSSLNLDGVSFDEHPLRVRGGPLSARFRYHLVSGLRHPSRIVRAVRNYRQTRREAEDGQDWAMRPMRAQQFRFVVHFATMGETVAEARAAGLDVLEAYAEDGTRLDPEAAHTDADYVHLVCAPVVVPS